MVAQVVLEPWSETDLDLERRINTPEMKVHLGGPEPDEQVVARHRRYLELPGTGKGRWFRIVLLLGSVPAGGVGYWEHEWRGETCYEMGWSVLPGFQGRGVARAAVTAALANARAEGRHRYLDAFPSVTNTASNALCRRTGFTFVVEVDFEFPKDCMMRSNHWRLNLTD